MRCKMTEFFIHASEKCAPNKKQTAKMQSLSIATDIVVVVVVAIIDGGNGGGDRVVRCVEAAAAAAVVISLL